MFHNDDNKPPPPQKNPPLKRKIMHHLHKLQTVAECFRRLLLTGVLIFFGPGSSLQIMIGCLLACFSIRAYLHFKPYMSTQSDWVAEFANIQIFLSFFAALCLRTGVASARGANQLTFGYLLVFLNLLAPVIALWVLIVDPESSDAITSSKTMKGLMFLVRKFGPPGRHRAATVVPTDSTICEPDGDDQKSTELAQSTE